MDFVQLGFLKHSKEVLGIYPNSVAKKPHPSEQHPMVFLKPELGYELGIHRAAWKGASVSFHHELKCLTGHFYDPLEMPP